MKKLVLALTVSLACVAAFGQGKIRLVNDSLHLVYYTTDTGSLLSADVASAGKTTQASGQLTSGQTLAVDLWAGTSAGTLSKIGTTTMAAGVDGTINGANYTVPGIGGGSSGFFQVQIYDASMGSYAAAFASQGHYYGESTIFSATTGGSLTYNSIVALGSPSFSTWAVGAQDESTSSYGAGSKGAIAIQANVPEPTSLALLGLGASSLMIFRRRK